MNRPDTKFQRWLETHNACLEARMWVGDKTFAQAWDGCDRPDWMFWVVGAHGRNQRATVLAAAAIARTALCQVPPGELRPLRAIEAAELWAAHPSRDTRANAYDAYAAARAVDAYDVYGAYAASAVRAAVSAVSAVRAACTSFAAVRATHAAAHAASAYDAASNAARAAAHAAHASAAAHTYNAAVSWTDQNKIQCDIIRLTIPRRGAR